MKTNRLFQWFGRKPSAAIAFTALVSLIFFCSLFYSHKTENDLQRGAAVPGEDSPDEAFRQNFLMTQDPALGYPPSERMEAVRYRIDMDKSSKAAAGNCITWDERGPGNVGGRTRAIMYDPND